MKFEKVLLKIILFFLAVILLFFQWKYDFLKLPAPFKIFLVSFLLLLPSGYFITKIMFRFDIVEIIPSSFVLGYVFFSIFIFFAYLFSLKLTTFFIIYLFLNILICSLFVLFYKQSTVQTKQKDSFLLLFAVSLVVFYLSIHYGAWISGDAIIHIPKIRQIVEINKIEYNSFFVKDLKIEQRGHNPLHPLLAVISLVSHLDPFYVWIYIITLLAPIKLFSFYIATKTIFDDRKFALFSSFILFFVEGILNRDFFQSNFSPFWLFGSSMPCVGPVVLNIFLPYILFLIFRYLKTEEKSLLVVLMLVCFSITLTHMMYYLYILFAIFSFFVFSFLFKKYHQQLYKKLLFAVIFLIIPSFFYTAYMTKKINRPLLNPAFKSATGEVSPGYYPIKFLDKEKKFPIVDPFIGIFPSLFSKIAFISVLFFLPKFKTNLFFLYTTSLTAMILLLLLNPILLHLLMPIHPPMQAYYGLVVIIPYVWLFSYFVWWCLEFIKDKLGRSFYNVLIIVFVIFIFLKLPNIVEDLENIKFTSKSSEDFFNEYQTLKKIVDSKIPYGSVVVMDKELLWYWPVFFSHFPLTHPNRGLLPPNYDVMKIDEEIKNLLENPNEQQSIEFVKRQKVDYIVLQKNKINKDKFQNFEKILEFGNLIFYKPIF